MSAYPMVKTGVEARKGRGFSRDELKDVGISVTEALKTRIPVDLRRSSKHEENVKLLKKYCNKPEPKKPAKAEKAEPAKTTTRKAKTANPKTVNKVIKAVEDARKAVK